MVTFCMIVSNLHNVMLKSKNDQVENKYEVNKELNKFKIK
jgi:hypothetical protein